MSGTTCAADGDDDDDGGGEDDDDENGSQNLTGPQLPGSALLPFPGAENLPAYSETEIVALRLTRADLAILTRRGYRLIGLSNIGATGSLSVRLARPADIGPQAARAEVRALRRGVVADLNHYYRPGQARPACIGEFCTQFTMVRLKPYHQLRAACGPAALIGIVDTAINLDNEAFANGRLEVTPVFPDASEASGIEHGTAVAALLVGAVSRRSPGLLPGARAFAVDAFYKSGRDERTDVFRLVQAIDALAKKGVRVINMSLSGPANDLLERMVDTLSAQVIVIVAAAGNAGPQAAPLYPGAYGNVIAVTAVDRNNAVYRRAAQGPQIDFAAPGVDVWTAALLRRAPQISHLFAAPFVSAAAAVVVARNPRLSPAEIVRLLARADPGSGQNRARQGFRQRAYSTGPAL